MGAHLHQASGHFPVLLISWFQVQQLVHLNHETRADKTACPRNSEPRWRNRVDTFSGRRAAVASSTAPFCLKIAYQSREKGQRRSSGQRRHPRPLPTDLFQLLSVRREILLQLLNALHGAGFAIPPRAPCRQPRELLGMGTRSLRSRPLRRFSQTLAR